MNDLAMLRETLVSLANSANDSRLIEAVMAAIADHRTQADVDLGEPREVTVNTMSLTQRNNAERLADKILGLK